MKGFTIIELIIIMAVIGLLIIIMYPAYKRHVDGANATYELVVDCIGEEHYTDFVFSDYDNNVFVFDNGTVLSMEYCVLRSND